MKVTGGIVRRRSAGRNLAFAEISVEESDNSGSSTTTSVVKVVFKRDSPSWNNDYDATFPARASALPYGARVSLELRERETDQGKRLEVHSWELISNPLESALEAAKQEGVGGISCSLYLQSRADAFSLYNKPPTQPKPARLVVNKEETSSLQNVQFAHGDNKAKTFRAQLFASWLISTFGQECLADNGGVLDIAGGNGKLSVELAVQGRIPCTIVDPLVRKHGKNLLPRDARRIKKANAPHPNHFPKPFNQTDFLQDDTGSDLVERASICVGLHPDQCTEDILDVALRFNKPFAIVPCCVFPGFFPLMRLRSGTAVRTYEQFLEYLLEKDERLKMECLPFQGRNCVIYCKSSA
jgi:hypothetical protein